MIKDIMKNLLFTDEKQEGEVLKLMSSDGNITYYIMSFKTWPEAIGKFMKNQENLEHYVEAKGKISWEELDKHIQEYVTSEKPTGLIIRRDKTISPSEIQPLPLTGNEEGQKTFEELYYYLINETTLEETTWKTKKEVEKELEE
jgi:hypothetical protein